MPAVDFALKPAMASRENAETSGRNTFGQRPTAENDFDRAMDNALTSFNRKPTLTKIPPPSGKNLPAEKNSSTVNFSAVKKSAATSTKDAEVLVSSSSAADSSQTSLAEKQKNSDATAANVSPELNVATSLAGATEPAPIFLSLPIFSYFDAPTEKGKVAVADPLAVNASKTGAADDAEKSVASSEKNSVKASQANLAPVTSAEAAALNAGLKTAIEKKVLDQNAATAETTSTIAVAKKDLPENNEITVANEKTAELPLVSDLTPEAAAPGKIEDVNSAVTPEGAVANAGTGVATTALPMKNSSKTNKVAELDVKVLPVGETDAAREGKLFSTVALPVRAADNRGADLNFTFSNGQSGAPVADNSPVLNVVDLPSLGDARMRAVERTHDMMALHSMRLVEAKMDTLSVVIKPSVGTELSLELRRHNGGVEAEATLTRGDHEFLSQHWPELQQRLEQRGIRLAALGGENNFAASDHGQFQRHQTSREEAAQAASAFAEFASTPGVGGVTARWAAIHDGWESWA